MPRLGLHNADKEDLDHTLDALEERNGEIMELPPGDQRAKYIKIATDIRRLIMDADVKHEKGASIIGNVIEIQRMMELLN